jgi:hypothetical protein
MPDAEQAQLSRQTSTVILESRSQNVEAVLEVQIMLLCVMTQGDLFSGEDLWFH